MEFLVVFGEGLQTDAAIEALSGVRLTAEPVSGGLKVARSDKLSVFHTGEPITLGERRVLFGGYVLDDSQLQEHGTLTATTARKLGQQTAHRGLRGVYCALSWEPEGAFCLHGDTLAQYPIFIWQRAETFCASNNLFFLESVLKQFERPATRSIESAMFEAVLEVGSGNRTGLDSVELLAAGNTWSGDGHHVQRSSVPTVFDEHIEKTPEGYRSNLSIAREGLIEFAEAIGKRAQNEKVIVDLTGGKDSRMVLAALVGAGVHREVEFFTNGPAASSDVLAAAPLYERYGLRPARFFQENRDEPIDAIEHSRRAVFRHQGCAALLRENPGKLRLLGQSRVHGASGELARAYFGSRPEDRASRSLQDARRDLRRFGAASLLPFLLRRKSRSWQVNAWAAFMAYRGGTMLPIVTRDFSRSIYQSLLRDFQNIAATAAEQDDWPDVFYAVDRARRHFGMATRLRLLTRSTFDPLADSSLFRASRSLTYGERLSGRVPFELIASLADEALALAPLADARWPPELARYVELDPESLAPPVTKNIEPTSPIPTFHTPAIWRQRGVPPTGVRATDGWGMARHVRALGNYAQELAGSISPNNACWDFLNRPKLLDLFADFSGWLRSLAVPSKALRLVHGLIWVAEQESRTQIRDTILDDTN